MLRSAQSLARRQTRLMSLSAAVKALSAEQKTLLAAVDALGPAPSYDTVTKLIASDPALKATLDKVKAEDLSWTWSMLESAPSLPPVTVAVAGSGPVAAATLYRIAAGEMLGLSQPVTLQVTDSAVKADLEACGFPLLKGVTAASSPSAALSGAAYAVVLDGDMKAAGAAAAPGTLVGVMGVANAMAAASASKASVTGIVPTALAAETMLATSAGVDPASVKGVIAWGSGVADISHATVNGKWALKEGGNVLPAVPEPSVAATADAVVAHMKAWATGSDGKWVSMGVPAVGDFGMGEGFFYSVPVVCTPGEYKRVGGVTLSPEVADVMEKERLSLKA